MPLLYLLVVVVLVALMLMLRVVNPDPLVFAVSLGGRPFWISAYLPEVLLSSAAVGAVLVSVPYLRGAWAAHREQQRLRQEAEALRQDNAGLRRDVENVRSIAMLLEARAAEAEERATQIEMERRPLLTMRPDDAPEPVPPRPAVPSRWRRR